MRGTVGIVVAATMGVVAWLTPVLAVAAPSPMTFPDWVSVPPDQSDEYPDGRAEKLDPPPSATVVVQCHRHKEGDLDHCRVISEAPKDLGFGALAAVAATLSRAVSPPASALTPDGDVVIPVTFDGQAEVVALREPKLAGRIVTHPDWVKKPRGDELARFFPDRAQWMNKGGRATIACHVTTAGSLESCRIVSETTENLGFGEAALAAARLFVMRPKTIDGEPVSGGVVVIPITFGTLNADTISPNPVWALTPTPAQIAAAYPKGATGVGHVVLQCGIAPTGRLQDCRAISEDPPAHGFAAATRGLAYAFQLKGDLNLGGQVAAVRVPITFNAPGTETVAPISNPIWTQMIDPQTMQSLFPTKAADAGLKAGKAMVDCVVDHNGQLTKCQAVSETPPGLGFGAAAVRVASVLAINPWTAEGRPVDGAHILLPLVMTLAPQAAKADGDKGGKP
jgi:TonB family protein